MKKPTKKTVSFLSYFDCNSWLIEQGKWTEEQADALWDEIVEEGVSNGSFGDLTNEWLPCLEENPLAHQALVVFLEEFGEDAPESYVGQKAACLARGETWLRTFRVRIEY